MTLTPKEREGRLREQFPWIEWEEPQAVTIQGDPSREGFLCRYCVAIVGFSARDPDPHIIHDTRESCERHLREHHGKQTTTG